MHPICSQPFMMAARGFGPTSDFAPLSGIVDGNRLRYGLDFDAFEKTFTPRTKIPFLCQLRNSTGQAYTTEELRRLAEITLRHELIIVSDEIHSELPLGGTAFTPTAAAALEARRAGLPSPRRPRR